MTDDASGGYRQDEREVETERVASWGEETRRYRRTPGGWWWLALLLIPLLLAALGSAVGGDEEAKAGAGASSSTTTSATTTSSTSTGSAGTSESSQSSTSGSGTDSPTSSATGDASVADQVFAITRTGEAVTVKAIVPDDDAKSALIDAVEEAVGTAEVKDEITVTSGVEGVDPAVLASALPALKDAGDFGLAWDLKSLVATGTVPDDAAKSAIGDALTAAWPGAAVDNSVSVGSDAAAACASLAGQIKVALADTKIEFEKYGTTPDSSTIAVLRRVAALAEKCPEVNLTVTGYTDASGSDSENKRLSEERAESVREVLVDNGVAAKRVESVGKGEADPIADNTTASGIAANRRVEITVN